MTAFFIALIPLAQVLVGGGSIEAALGSITFAQWAVIAVQAVAAGPTAIKFLEELHPALVQFASDIEKNMSPHDAAATLRADLPKLLAKTAQIATQEQLEGTIGGVTGSIF